LCQSNRCGEHRSAQTPIIHDAPLAKADKMLGDNRQAILFESA